MRARGLEKSFAQTLKVLAIVYHTGSSDFPLVVHGYQCVAITVLAFVHIHQSCHHAVKFVKCVLVSAEVLAAIVVHG